MARHARGNLSVDVPDGWEVDEEGDVLVAADAADRPSGFRTNLVLVGGPAGEALPVDEALDELPGWRVIDEEVAEDWSLTCCAYELGGRVVTCWRLVSVRDEESAGLLVVTSPGSDLPDTIGAIRTLLASVEVDQ